MSSSEQDEIQRTIARLVGDRSSARRAAEGALIIDRDLWGKLAELGLLGVSLPEAMGGSELGLDDECVVAEALSAFVAPVPVVSTYLAAHILAASAEPAAETLGLRLSAGEAVVAPCLGAETGKAVPFSIASREGGEARLVGEASDLFEGAAADVFLVWADGAWWSVETGAEGVEHQVVAALDPTRQMANLTLDNARATRVGDFDPEVLLRLAYILLGAEAVGVSQAALDMATQYALVRHQFGQPIGRFQAIKQKMADSLIALEAARSSVWGALRSAQDGIPEAQAALLAAVKSAEGAPLVVGNAVQTHGAIGVTWEHDLHLLQRRAKHCQITFGAPEDLYAQIGDQLMVPVARGSRQREEFDVGFVPGGEDEAFIEEFRAFLDANMPSERVKELRSTEARREWQAQMAEGGWAGIHWPKAYGGRDATFTQQVLYYAELVKRGFPAFPGNRGLMLIGPTLIAHGNETTRKLVEPTRRADLMWAGGFSERGSGSDLASLRTKGVIDGDELVIDGHKIWTSQAQYADWIYALIRTGPLVPKHAGISVVLIYMKSKGVEVRPIRRNTGDFHFNEVFFDAVRVPLSHVVGELNDGWRVNRTTMVGEHLTNFLGTQAAQATTIRRITRALAEREARTGASAAMRRRLAEAWAVTNVVRLHGLRNVVRFTGGENVGAEGSIQKLAGQENDARLFELMTDIQGVTGLHDGAWARAYLSTRASTIGGGTSEIHRNKIAERVLGLPRDLWADEDAMAGKPAA
jgi:alkylation response protein AidB-like acyl-CoA dehydrogenase